MADSLSPIADYQGPDERGALLRRLTRDRLLVSRLPAPILASVGGKSSIPDRSPSAEVSSSAKNIEWSAVDFRPFLEAVGDVARIIDEIGYMSDPLKLLQKEQVTEIEDLRVRLQEMERGMAKRAQDLEEANVRLRASYTTLAETQAISHVGSFELDIASGAVSWSDEQFRIFGYKPGSIETDFKVFTDAIHPDDRERVDSAHIHCLASGEPFDAEFRILRADGIVRWIRQRALVMFDNGSPVRTVGSSPIRLVGSTEDITERLRAEEERSVNEQRLRQVHKMEAVGQLAGGIAHDFNNILAVVLNCAEFVAETLDIDHEGHKDLGEIVKASERGAELIQQLLAFSRQEVIKPTVIDLNEVVEGMTMLLARSVGEDIELSINTPTQLSRTKADHGQIEQVLLNLVVNARDAMPGGGRIQITTADVNLEMGVRAGLPAGPYVCLNVTDSGTGIDPETLDRIFEPFFTTKERGEGTGLGLATVYGIVKQAQGGIYADSEIGTGTSFSVYLPITDEEMSAPVQKTMVDPGIEATILVVEDEAQVRDVIVRILRREGFEVIEVASGAEAVEVCSVLEQEIDLLLSDVVMPGMSGPAVRDALLPLRPEMKVLFMSGYTDELLAKRGELDRGADLINKPFNSERLVNRVREALQNKT